LHPIDSRGTEKPGRKRGSLTSHLAKLKVRLLYRQALSRSNCGHRIADEKRIDAVKVYQNGALVRLRLQPKPLGRQPAHCQCDAYNLKGIIF